MKTKARKLAEFETIHGVDKIRRIQAELEIERRKVSELAGKKDAVSVIPLSDKRTLRFGVFGDTQFGNLYSCPENLEAYYRAADDMGCEVMLHTGDVLDGWKVYKGQEFELQDVGFEAQISRLKMSAPTTIPTKFICGNHDLSFKNLIGMDVGRAIQKAAPNWEHVGDDEAIVALSNSEGKSFLVGLYHLRSGTSYAISYKPQKHVEQMEGGRKPQLACYGHFHKAEFVPSYRNVAICQSGCFEWQTPFMRGIPTAAHVGGWIFEVSMGETYNLIRGTFLAVYR